MLKLVIAVTSLVGLAVAGWWWWCHQDIWDRWGEPDKTGARDRTRAPRAV